MYRLVAGIDAYYLFIIVPAYIGSVYPHRRTLLREKSPRPLLLRSCQRSRVVVATSREEAQFSRCCVNQSSQLTSALSLSSYCKRGMKLKCAERSVKSGISPDCRNGKKFQMQICCLDPKPELGKCECIIIYIVCTFGHFAHLHSIVYRLIFFFLATPAIQYYLYCRHPS